MAADYSSLILFDKPTDLVHIAPHIMYYVHVLHWQNCAVSAEGLTLTTPQDAHVACSAKQAADGTIQPC